MIPCDALINRLRDLGYEFKRQADRVMIYKKSGGTTRIAVRRRDMLDVSYVRSLLKQAGLAETDIDTFVSATATKPN